MAKETQKHQSSSLPPPWDRILPTAVRVAVWIMLFIVLYILRSFFLLLFLTFVFGYIQARGVERLKPKIPNRTTRVVLVGLALLTVVVSIGAFIIPRVRDQAITFADRFPEHVRSVDQGLLSLGEKYPLLKQALNEISTPDSAHPERNIEARRSVSAALIQRFLEDEDSHGGNAISQTVNALRNFGVKLLAAGSAFLLSLLFSFLIVLDLPALMESVRQLKNSKVRFIYEEVSGSIFDFSQIMGRAIEAQLFIALLNTTLTAAGIWLLGLADAIAFLSVIVFICSFIPIAGVFISSVPICLLALQESGVHTMFLAIGLITVVHMIEAYVLNPKIYGHHLRMNPVIVLIILTIGGKLFGVWGLVLGVPLCNYLFGHAVRYDRDRA